MRSRAPARLLALLALAAAGLAVYLIVSSESGSGDGSRTAKSSTTRSSKSASGSSKAKSRPAARRSYRVKPGDTLSGIAESTGVSLSRLEELNPDLDAQTLRTGATLKLSP